jgi:carboxymethylenebutenolidase
MIEAEVEIKTRDGEMNAFVTHPEEGGPFPAVFFYMDAPGKREELHDGRRIATVGYYVVLPNQPTAASANSRLNRDEAGMKRMFELMSSPTNTKVVEDTEAMFAYVDRHRFDAERWGWSLLLSGPFVCGAAQDLSESPLRCRPTVRV